MRHRSFAAALALLCATLTAAAPSAYAAFIPILTEDFETPSGWTYSGPTNSSGDPLFQAIGGRLFAEWDQQNHFDGSGDPYVIAPALYRKPLSLTLTDADTFRVSVLLELGGVTDTTEFFQIANFGLYNVALHGADRAMSDNWSGNTTLVKDGSDFVEFNYFINNKSFGFNPSISAVIGAHIAGVTGDYTTGSGADPFFNNTDMGPDHWLPGETDLYVRLTYYGAAGDATRRRAHVGIYTDAGFTTLLVVNGATMSYWTQPLPESKGFTLTDVAFYNYPGANWGGTPGAGYGLFDDLTVEVVPEPGAAGLLAAGLAAAVRAARRRRAG